MPGLSSVEKAELVSAKKRIAELAISRRAMELLRVSSDPRDGFRASRTWAPRNSPSKSFAESSESRSRATTSGADEP